MVSRDMLLSMINSDFSQKSFVMLYVKNVCKYLFIFTPYFLKLVSNVSKHVVEYDKLRFQREIICNVVCEECLQISIYIYPLFSQMVSNDMLLSMINSDFSLKSFVMLYVKNVCKYLFIFTPYFLKWCQHVVEYDKLRHICCCMINISDFKCDMLLNDKLRFQLMLCNVKNVCKYLFIFTPYFLKWCHATCC